MIPNWLYIRHESKWFPWLSRINFILCIQNLQGPLIPVFCCFLQQTGSRPVCFDTQKKRSNFAEIQFKFWGIERKLLTKKTGLKFSKLVFLWDSIFLFNNFCVFYKNIVLKSICWQTIWIVMWLQESFHPIMFVRTSSKKIMLNFPLGSFMLNEMQDRLIPSAPAAVRLSLCAQVPIIIKQLWSFLHKTQSPLRNDTLMYVFRIPSTAEFEFLL